MVATLGELDRGPPLIEILREPKNSLVRQYQTIMGFENVELRFTDDAWKRSPRRRSSATSAHAA